MLYDSQPSAVFFVHTHMGVRTSIGSDILYFLVVCLEEIFCRTQTAANFGNQDISKCLNNLLLAVEQTNK